LWVYILRTVPLSFAYPFSALGFVLVPVAAKLIFGESIGRMYLIGAVLVIGGLLFIFFDQT